MKARDFRQTARDALRGNWGKACIAGVIYSALAGGGGSFNFEADDSITSLPNTTISWEAIAPMIPIFLGAFVLGFAIALILGSLVGVGYAQFNIDLIDGMPLSIKTLFSKARQLRTAIGANLLIALRVFGGMLLFIIPGIIAAYKYAMVNHVLADDPTLTAREALQRSKEIMRGNKWRLFCLGFSFFVWYLLVAITFGIAAIWVVPYEQAAVAAFYKEIK